jgi:lipopolysaccharide transport system ATP-binding protein
MTSMIAPMLGLDLEATGLENIRNLGLMRFLSKKQIADRVDAIVEFSGLGDFIRLPVRTYSQGMIARLTFAVATEFDADILLLDEWLGAGDATFVHQASERMQRMADRAKILVLATHSYDLVETTCNKVCEMHAGKVAYFGSTDGWRRHRDAQAA